MDPCGEMSNSGGTLASAAGLDNLGDVRTVNGTQFTQWTQATIVFNDSPAALQYAQTPRCFQDIFTHELGHSIGLLHSDDPNALMYPFQDRSCLTASTVDSVDISGSLGSDDIAGIRFIYPPPSGGGGSGPAPSNLTATLSGTSVTLQWSAPSSGATVTS